MPRLRPWLLASALILALICSPAFAQPASWEAHTQAGRKAFGAGDEAATERHFRAALEAAEAFAPDDPRRPESLYQLGQILAVLGRTAEAEPYLKRALALVEEIKGANHPHVAGHLENLAGLYRELGRERDAAALIGRAWNIRENSADTNHLRTNSNSNKVQGRHADAERSWTSYMKDARVADSLGRYVDAEAYLLAAVQVANSFGVHDSRLASASHELALLYRTQGNYPDAEPLFRHALSIYEIILGTEHPHVAVVINALAMNYHPGLFTNPLAVDFSACDASLVAGSFAAGESRVLPQLCDSHLRHERREEAAVEASGTATGDPAVA